MIEWVRLNGKPVGRVLRTSSWELPLAIIADETRSGKPKVRGSHFNTPNMFNIDMLMTLEEYRVFSDWWRISCRRGVRTFAYPKIDDNTGVIVEYRFNPDSNISIQNISGDILELKMIWQEVV